MSQRIAILGAGVMGETLLAAIVRSGHPTSDIVITEKRAERAVELRDRYGVAVMSNPDAVADADVILLLVKPQDAPALLGEIGPLVRPGSTVVSLAAGVRIATVQGTVPDGVAVVRAMPNTPALVGQGMFGVSAGEGCSDTQLAAVVDLLGLGGKVVVVEESQQDALTAVSGSGPAYVFYLAEAMIAGGIEAGLDPQTAQLLTEQTLLGAATLLAESTDDAAELRRKVTSPGGTTAAAIEAFDTAGVAAGVVAGVVAAAARSAELSGTS